ncbi:hypothetical protein N7491_002575 [Penicillium cf. griseofulvum]|uniref:Uncharacterized protein n=1 Tax=Penicillium cf. griseofulvum TaxID=2972120 RepID=A0A9W9T291_9EURO|nr:hypothetical protein N7472_003241 [Penicillium cf. griseofulvum]KAJ5446493.1 hypothetical protein N7491_002575 [Penicillium cf. griseofulvum]KAJ5448234.1 hypothetical protein N7445_003055 [Penicillium cf. griseofulvum]
MGNKVSAVNGVKSDHFYDQGNAVNEIWVGDVEIISRLPFGDSDLEQAGWPPGDFPKIPWHHFIIPMHKRNEASNMTTELPKNGTCGVCPDWLPKHGYLGMYTSISESAAYLFGILFLLLALGMYLYFMTGIIGAFFNWQWLREESHLYPDPAAIRRMAKHNLWIGLGESFMVLALSILCFVLGVPALAAGTRRMDATTFILLNGLGGGVTIIFAGLVALPSFMLWWTKKPRSVKTSSF